MTVPLAVRMAIAAIHQAHDFAERILLRFNQDMVVVGHEAPSENRERVPRVDMQKCAHQFAHVFFCAENSLPVVAAYDDVVIGIRIELASSRHMQPPSDREALAK